MYLIRREHAMEDCIPRARTGELGHQGRHPQHPPQLRNRRILRSFFWSDESHSSTFGDIGRAGKGRNSRRMGNNDGKWRIGRVSSLVLFTAAKSPGADRVGLWEGMTRNHVTT